MDAHRKQLLVIRFSALGDVAMLAPLMRQVALSYPDWDFTMLSRQQCAPLFNDMPSNVHFFGADLKGHHHRLWGLDSLLKEIDYHKFDAVADMHDVLRSQYLRTRMFLAGKRCAHVFKARVQRWLLVRHNYHHKQPLVPMIERYRAVFTELGFYTYGPLTLNNGQTVPKTNIVQEEDTPARHNIGIAPFAAHRGKIYPINKMKKVVKTLGEEMAARGEKVLLFGAGSKEELILHEWEKKYDGVECMAGKSTMDQEIAIMRGLRLMVTMDSANMHLASLAGTRVLSIWGATHPWAGFLGYGQKESDCIQLDLACRPCSIYGNRFCQYRDYRCLNIDEDYIIARVKTALNEQ